MFRSRRSLILLTLTSVLNCAQAAQTGQTVTIHPGDNVQSIVESHAAGTTYVFSAGMYRRVEIQPHDNDIFIATGRVILNGAEQLFNFSRSGNLWYVDGQTQKGQLNGSCLPTSPMCAHPEDLFFDEKPLLHVSSLSQVGPGKWFFDYNAGRIYFADSPSGHYVETSAARSAFSGQAKNVRISGFEVEKYASPAQMGAIGDQYPGPGWTINDNEVRLNHGEGIRAGSGASIIHNWIHNNGQLGLGGDGDNILVEGNTLSYTGFAGFNPSWEVGGSKISSSHNLVFRSNTAHDNVGAGLWTDVDNFNSLYEYNVVYNNQGAGIQNEISWSATIRYNVAYNNGIGQSVWLWGSQIAIVNSSNVEAHHNRVVVPNTYGNGIGIIYQNRGSGPNGEYVSANNYIHDNDITFEGVVQGTTGMVVDYNPTVAYESNNKSDYNHYHMPDTTRYHWNWRGNQNWLGMLQLGFEGHGTLDTDTTTAVRNLPLPSR